jgi:hypothetical protein
MHDENSSYDAADAVKYLLSLQKINKAPIVYTKLSGPRELRISSKTFTA